jgi:hypothetical protein
VQRLPTGFHDIAPFGGVKAHLVREGILKARGIQ